MRKKFFWIQLGYRFLIIALLLMIAYKFPSFIGVDLGGCRIIKKKFLNGLKPYIDIIDINPPMIIYLNVIPVLLANTLNFTLVWAFVLAVLFLIIICASLLKKIIAASGVFTHKQIMFVDFMFYLSSLYILLRHSYGQREHLFSICLVPYLFLRIFRSEIKSSLSMPVVASIGILCGIMSVLKPYFLFIIFILEMSLIYSEKSWKGLKKPEVFYFLLPICLYVVHFLFWPRNMLHAFFGELVPMVLKHYNSMDYPTIELLLKSTSLILALLFSIILYINLKKKFGMQQRSMFNCFLAVGASALSMYLLQHKGWTYQQVPSIFAIGIILTFSLIHFFKNLKSFTAKQKIVNYLSIGLIIFCFLYPIKVPIDNMFGVMNSTDAVFSQSNGFLKWSMRQVLVPGDKIVVFSATPAYLYPYITQMEFWPGTRYMFHFPLVFFNSRYTTDLQKPYPYKALEQMEDDERQYIERVQEDIEKNKPKMLAFASNKHNFSFLPENFNVFEYFKASGSWDKWKPYYDFAYKEHDIVVFKRKMQL